jgi:GNAT superfamily N-acetyltransferase
MFANASLAARIDRAEARLCSLFAESKRGMTTDDAAMVTPINGGHAVYAGLGSPINKVIGLGFDGALDVERLAEIECDWHARGEPVRVELSILAEPTIGTLLTERGYRLHGFENVLGRRLDEPDAASRLEHIAIEVIQDKNLRPWLDIALDAFMNLDGTGSVPPDAFSREQLERSMLDFTAVPGMTQYVARINGDPAGEAAMRIDDGLAQLAGSGTLPAFRGRGVQKALVERRLHDARTAGCDLAVVVTAPGTRSQDNVMRRGFALLYTRAILIRPPACGGPV